MPPLRHAGHVRHAEFSPGGRTLITASLDQTARIWDVSPNPEFPKDFSVLAHLLASREIDVTGGLSPLDPDLLKKNWLALQPSLPPALHDQKSVSWHEREAAVSETSRQWFAAAFHLEKLIEAKPGDQSLRKRRSAALLRAKEKAVE